MPCFRSNVESRSLPPTSRIWRIWKLGAGLKLGHVFMEGCSRVKTARIGESLTKSRTAIFAQGIGVIQVELGCWIQLHSHGSGLTWCLLSRSDLRGGLGQGSVLCCPCPWPCPWSRSVCKGNATALPRQWWEISVLMITHSRHTELSALFRCMVAMDLNKTSGN